MIHYLLVIMLMSPSGDSTAVIPEEFDSLAACTKELEATKRLPMNGYKILNIECVKN
jgi:hypothetical protein